MADFATWKREALEQFAADATAELQALKDDLRVAIDAYRALLRKTDRSAASVVDAANLNQLGGRGPE